MNTAHRLVVTISLVLTGIVLTAPAAPVANAAGTPDVSLTSSLPSEVLYGDVITVTLTATGEPVGGADGYNLSFNDVLPVGATFGSSTPAPTSILPQVDSTTVVVWENVADLLAGATVSLTYTFTIDPNVFSIGDTVSNRAGAYVNNVANVRSIPDFDPVTGAATGDYTGWDDNKVGTTTLIPFELSKSETNTEGEILRGVHDHKTVFRLTVDNNLVEPSDDFVLVDYLPAGLEFLGCAAVDNSTPGTYEYTGTGSGANRRIDDTAHPTMTRCATPTSVTTVTTDPDQGGPMPNDVYTRVAWDEAAIEAATGTTFPLAAPGSFFIEYAAAIPLRENVDIALSDPTANLDNNTGALTTDEQDITNYAEVSGITTGTSYSDTATLTRSAEDISIHKSVVGGPVVQTEDRTWTLDVESSEYLVATDTVITVTDSIPNGLGYVSSDTTLSGGPTDEPDGTQTVEWQIPGYTAPNSSTTITFVTTVLSDYRSPLTGPVATNDGFTNQVSLATAATIITGNDGSTTSSVDLVDASSAGLSTGSVTIEKEVSAPVTGPLTCGDGSGIVWDEDVAYDYRAGDRVCWRLSITFTTDLDTLDPFVKDFLPPGYTYEGQQWGAGHTLGTGVTYDGTGEPDGVLVWDLDDADPTGDRFEVVVSSRITDTSGLSNADITQNLMKYSFVNTDGSLFQLREQAEARFVEPVLSIDKSAPTGPFTGGDDVVYDITVTNAGFIDAQNATIVDTLPTGIDCTDVSVLGGATCVDNAPGRDTVTWTAQTVPRATEVAPVGTGTVDSPGELALSYTVRLPGTFEPGTSLTNDVAVTSYETPTNTTFGPEAFVGPATSETITIRNATFAKSASTAISEVGNSASQATIGETVTYTLSATIPQGTSSGGAAITDTVPTGVRIDAVSATLNAAPLPGTFTLANTSTDATLTLPDPYTNAVGSGDDAVVMTITATVIDTPSNVAGVDRVNTGNFTWANGSIDRTATIAIVEPILSVAKAVDDGDDIVDPGQPVEYTLTVSNTGSVAHDVVVVDTVPADVIPQAGGIAAAPGNTVDGTGGTGIWSGDPARTITWIVPSVSAGSNVVLTYDTVIDDPLTGGREITNSVVVTGSSIAGTGPDDPDERTTYSASADKTVTAPILSILSKSADVADATVGDLVTYDVQVGLPADLLAYDVTVLDVLPAGMAFEAFTGQSCSEPAAAPCVPARPAVALSSAGDTGTIAFFVNDVTAASAEPQIVTLTYTARVLDDDADVTDGDALVNSVRTYHNITDKIIGIPFGPPAPGSFDNSSAALTAQVDVIEPRLTVDKDVLGQVGDSDTRRAKPGDVLTYSVTVRNAGSSPAWDITITDTPDPRLTDFTFSPPLGSPVISVTDADPSDGSLAWATPGPIAAGESVTLTYTLTVPNSLDETDEVAGFELTNSADVTRFYGASSATRTANPTVGYREYGDAPYDVTADTVSVELDLASIGNRVWYDIDADGVQDGGEPGLESVPVTVTFLGVDNLFGTPDDEAVTVTTGALGAWLVDELPGGRYVVDVDATAVPAGLVPSYDLDDGTTTPDGDWIGTLAEADAKRDVDTGFTGAGSIGDTIWFDQDLSGVQNGNEGGIPGIGVTLVWSGPNNTLGDADDVTYTDTTNSSGGYLFDDLPAGLFEISATVGDLPTGTSFVSDPDVGAADGVAHITLVGVGDNDLTQDFGIAGAGVIGDTIYLDRDGDGSQAVTGEPGLEGVTVTLAYAGPDGVLGGAGAGDDEVYTDVTDSSGVYRFENLPASDYSITVSGPLPSGAVNSGDPDDPVGSGDGTSAVTLGDGTIIGDDVDLDQDFGYDVNSRIGDRIWWDLDRDGVQDSGEPGINGVTVTVTYLGPDGVAGGGDDLVFTDVTSGDGDWAVDEVPDGDYTVAVTSGVPAGFDNTYDPDDGVTAPDGSSAVTLSTFDEDQDFGYAGRSSIGDTVWLDLDDNGVLDGDEVGIADVTVNVTWAGPTGVLGDADDVTFVRTTADDGTYRVEGLPAGVYEVEVVDTTLPSGLTNSYDVVNGTTAPTDAVVIALAAATDMDTVDFGYRGSSSIGDTVYFDRNVDGDRDLPGDASDEPGLEAVDVRVTWSGPDGIFGNADDGVFTVATDSGGGYVVGGLPAGTYHVDVVTATLPGGMTNTADEDGDLDSSTPVTLAVGDDHPSADFGYAGAASIGDTIYLDLDGDATQDLGEPGVPGQTVRLSYEGPDGILGNADDVVFTTVTGPTGRYRFENLPNGDYRVTVVGGIAAVAANSGDPDGGTADEADSTIAAGISDLGQDFGYQGDNSVGDTVWWDVNRDGAIGPSTIEPRLADVAVRVTFAGVDGVLGGAGSADDVVVTTIATDVDGEYVVTGLPDGDYLVAVLTTTLPAGMDNTADADDGVVGDGGTDPDSQSFVTLPGATDDRSHDFGYAGAGSIGDVVYFDRDGSGTRGTIADEPGIAGVEVTLTFAGTDGSLGTTDDITIVRIATPDGGYDFIGLPAGDYSVEITDGLPSGAVNSDDPDLPGSAPDVGDSISSVTLGVGEDNDVQDFGFDVDAALGDRVWWDFDRDGVQDPGEPGFDGIEITVTFLGADGVLGGTDDEQFVTTTTTVAGEPGSWSVTDIPEGNYRIAITDGVPAGFTNTFDPDTGIVAPDGTADLDGHAGVNVGQDFGIAGNSSIGDTVWLDLDGDGTLNGQEVGLEMVIVGLTWFGPDGTSGGTDDQTFTTATDTDGQYLFEGLPAGTYVVTVDQSTLPAGMSASFDRDGTTVSADGTTQFGLLGDTDLDDLDFGFRGDSSIGDTIFFDRDRDRAQNVAPGTGVDEPGIAGIDVELTWAGEDETLGTADDHRFSTTTDADGNYRFDGLPAGDFVVDVVGATLPTAMTNTVDEDGDDNGSTTVVLVAADDHDTADFGYTGAASIGDTIYLDLDGDGAQGPDEPGVAAHTVTLVGPVGTLTTTTSPDGTYSFDNLPDGAYTVTVTGGIVTAATNTDDPDGPAGTGDSTAAATISGGVSLDDLDFGYRGSAALGDTLFLDADGDGLDDGVAADPRLDGVDIVVVWLGPDGVVGGGDDVTIPVAPTDTAGDYTVTGLPSGIYTVVPDVADLPIGLVPSVDPDDGSFADGNAPDGAATVTLADGEINDSQDFGYQGTGAIGDTVWLDLDGDGIHGAGEPGFEGAAVTLTWHGPDGIAGGGDDVVLVTTVADDGSYGFEHLPAGDFMVDVSGLPGGLSPTADPDGGGDSSAAVSLDPGESDTDQNFGYIGTAAIGDTVWLDVDGDGEQGTGEPGLAGVVVTVTSAGVDDVIGTTDDLVVTSATTSSGTYSIPGLPAGPTRVAIDPATLPSDAMPDTDADGGDPSSAVTTLIDGETDIDQDFGVRGPGSIDGSVFSDDDGDGAPTTGEAGFGDITITITFDGPDAPLVITTVTEPDGSFVADGLPSGDYTVEVLADDQPADTIPTGPTSVAVTVSDDSTPRVDFPFVEPGSIGQRVFVDTNHDGVQNAGEGGAAGVVVRLRGVDGQLIATVATDAAGDFVFAGLAPGTYTVELDTSTVPAGLRLSTDPDGVVDAEFVVTIGPGEHVRTAIFGLSAPQLAVAGAAVLWTIWVAFGLMVLGLSLLLGRRRRAGTGAVVGA